MPQNVNVYVKTEDGEELFFRTQRQARQYIGCNWITLKHAAASGKKVGRKEKFTVRFETEPYKPSAHREWVSFYLQMNTMIGLRIVAERNKKNVTQFMRDTLFEAYPERYLWQLGADSEHGLKNVPYEPINSNVKQWNTTLPKGDPYKPHNPRKKPYKKKAVSAAVNSNDKSEPDET